MNLYPFFLACTCYPVLSACRKFRIHCTLKFRCFVSKILSSVSLHYMDNKICWDFTYSCEVQQFCEVYNPHGNICFCLNAMEQRVRLEVQLHWLVASALDGAERSGAQSGRFILGKICPVPMENIWVVSQCCSGYIGEEENHSSDIQHTA